MTRYKKGKMKFLISRFACTTISIQFENTLFRMPFMSRQFKNIDLILISDFQLVPIYRCDLLLSFPTSYAYHKEVHRRGRLFSTERHLRFFHIWARFVSVCLANSSCTNCNGKNILMIIYQQYAPFFHLMELQYMADMQYVL